MRPIEDIKVYNPKEKGINYETIKAVEKINPEAAYRLIVGLYEAVSQSRVGENLTLNDYLFLPGLSRTTNNTGGYFARNPNVSAVLFMDGKFHSQYNGAEQLRVNLEELAKGFGSIPFMFSQDPGREPVNFLFDQGLIKL